MAEQTVTNYEERKQRRLSMAEQPGTMVFNPRSNLSYNNLAYVRLIDRAIARIQANLFQPGNNKDNIEKAQKLLREYNENNRKIAIEMCSLADVKFYDPENRENAK